jgi:molybdopterin-guanine dinucleotide biosynthesis protein A
MTQDKQKSLICKIAGAILAGGTASRMGGLAKGTLQINNNISFIQHIAKQLALANVTDVVIVANDPKSYANQPIKVVADIRKNVGPMAGIETALDYFADICDAVLFVPCDMPLVTADQILTLKNAFITKHTPAAFVVTARSLWHPLCAVAHKDIKKIVSAAIDKGERKIRNVWKQLGALEVNFDDDTPFLNINTIEDLNRWKNQLKS